MLIKPVTIAFALTLLAAKGLTAADNFELRDGDRVVFLGNTLVERDQTHGYLETLLIRRFPDRSVTFRNLGWSGDTVFGHARAGFGSTEDGFRELTTHVQGLNPTVIFVGYGMNESFEGQAGLPKFLSGLERLLGALAETKARIVILGPNRHEDLGRPLPDPAEHNRGLRIYADALEQVAETRGVPFIDLYALLDDGAGSKGPLTDNGIHFNAYGYWRAAAAIERGLGLTLPAWQVDLNVAGGEPKTSLTKLKDVRLSPQGGKFTALDSYLPIPRAPKGSPSGVTFPGHERVLRVTGLAAGQYTLSIDGQLAAKAKAEDWAKGVALVSAPDYSQVEKLRQKTLDKNSLYFYRWRPQNWTYLFGFRKHEQGQNAREIPEFDPLVAAQEVEIAKLRVPVAHGYTISLEGVARP